MTATSDFLTAHDLAVPIVQAPMAGSNGAPLAAAVSGAGGLGSIPCAMLSLDKMAEAVADFRARTDRPLNLNFFTHTDPDPGEVDPTGPVQSAWKALLAPYYEELGLDPSATSNAPARRPFDAEACALVERVRPEVVSFHFGLPDKTLVDRVKATGARVWGCATTVAEAVWLAERGVDAVIAQGAEAGGHRGIFLAPDVIAGAAQQPGTLALVPQVVDAVAPQGLPVIAAGGIADSRGIVAALALGAAAVQIGTAYLRTPEAATSPVHRRALAGARDDGTALTNMLSGRPARGLMNRVMTEHGPINRTAPAFPAAGTALAPLRAKAEAADSADFSPIWSGQAAALATEEPADQLTRRLWTEATERRLALSEA